MIATRRRSTLRSAIAEAAGMTAFERNGDVVHFASYAPLLARRNHTQWHPDMIYFTGTEVYLTANYYVQQLFGQNSGDTYLATTINSTAKPPTLAASTVRDSKSGDLIVKIVNGARRRCGAESRPRWAAGGNIARDQNACSPARIADAYNEDGQPPAVNPSRAK